jgi:hypothetical protein
VVSCRSGDNKCRETLTFKVESFDIGYNCIHGRLFLLKFMAFIHTAYATMNMPGPKGVITIKVDQRDALACRNASLSHIRRFSDKAAQEYAAKEAETHGGSDPCKTSTPKPATSGAP